jgi:hypothetical protein
MLSQTKIQKDKETSCRVAMKMNLSKSFPAERWAYFFMALHLICWTAVPALVRCNLPLDAIEGTTWGHQLEWGYDKNPFLNGWLTALATYLGGPSGWMIYLFSQISVTAGMWSVWQLGKRILPATYALIAVMILEGLQYFNFHSIDFNDNTLEVGLWALTIYFIYRALRTPHLGFWLLTGAFAGLGMMAKYYTAALLTALTLFLFWHSECRKQLMTIKPYIGLLVFSAICAPHFVWLFSHEFITVTYVFDRARSEPSWTNHFYFPAQYIWQQLQVLSPSLVLFSILLIGKRPALKRPKFPLDRFDQAFLFCIAFGPLLLTALLSVLLGIKLRAGWGAPLLSFWGLVIVALVQPSLTAAKLNRFIGSTFILLAALLVGYSVSLTNSPDKSSANFPGQAIADRVTQIWHDRFHTNLKYIAGSRWVGGNIGFYGKDQPAVFIEWDKRKAPWIDVSDMQKQGAIFLWSITDHESMPTTVIKQYPRLEAVTVLEFPWRRNHHHLSPIKIGIAVLPPQV